MGQLNINGIRETDELRINVSVKKGCESMEKLKNLLSKWIDPYRNSDNGKIYRRPKNLSLYLITEMQRIYRELEHNGRAYFLSDDLVPYLKKCGIKVTAPHDEIIAYLAHTN